MTPLPRRDGRCAARLVEVRAPAGSREQRKRDRSCVRPAAPHVPGRGADPAVGALPRGDRRQRDPVEVHQADVPQRRRQPLHVQELGRIAAVARGRSVDNDVQRQVLLLEEELQEQAVKPAEDVPVDVPQVVPHDVGAVIRELDGLAPLLRPPLALELARKDLLAGQVEPREPGDQSGSEQLVDRPWAGWRGCAEHRGLWREARSFGAIRLRARSWKSWSRRSRG